LRKTQAHYKKKNHERKKEDNTEFMGELLKRKEEGFEGKQSIPIYKVRSLAN